MKVVGPALTAIIFTWAVLDGEVLESLSLFFHALAPSILSSKVLLVQCAPANFKADVIHRVASTLAIPWTAIAAASFAKFVCLSICYLDLL